MSVHLHDTDGNPAAERLARAMRSGLELRWSIPDPSPCGANPFPPNGDVRSFLEPDANSLHYHFPHRGQRFSSVVRAARYLVRKLIAPWLHLQTRFNLSTIRVIEQLHQRVRALEDAEAVLRQAIETLEKTNRSRADYELGQHRDTREEEIPRRLYRE